MNVPLILVLMVPHALIRLTSTDVFVRMVGLERDANTVKSYLIDLIINIKILLFYRY